MVVVVAFFWYASIMGDVHLINSLVCWFCTSTLGLILFQICSRYKSLLLNCRDKWIKQKKSDMEKKKERALPT